MAFSPPPFRGTSGPIYVPGTPWPTGITVTKAHAAAAGALYDDTLVIAVQAWSSWRNSPSVLTS